MSTLKKQWSSGTGEVTITYGGIGNGQIIISSDGNNLYEARSMQIVVQTTAGSPQQTKTVNISQAARVRTDISNAVVTAANQTYSGSALTPAPTVKLNGVTIPSTGYDVTYSNNTNAGTATVTVTGKGDYTGTASGTFTIAKASRTLSFPNAYVVLAPSGNITKTATPSAGSGDGAITYSIGSTTYATINSSSGKVTAKTTEGNTTVTATIAEGTNYLGATTTYTLYVFATTHNYDYSGSAKSLTLPPGSYKLQVWGAQGGSNAADSNYGITAKAGGKGGYSEGQLTVASETPVKIYVGGQGSSSAGGYNGGGSTTGESSYNSDDVLGISKMGGGGGASDIRLSDGALLSRMIVAGGGSGGAMCYKRWYEQTQTTVIKSLADTTEATLYPSNGGGTNPIPVNWINIRDTWTYKGVLFDVSDFKGESCSLNASSYSGRVFLYSGSPTLGSSGVAYTFTGTEFTIPDDVETLLILYPRLDTLTYCDITLTQTTITEHTSTESSTGFVGGGGVGGGYNDSYKGAYTNAGYNGDFGQGANQQTTNYRYCSAAAGGGWYGGGGGQKSNTDMTYCKYSGGGSGFVNTSANAHYRPSGYTGLQLDSGSTKNGTQTFVSPSGTNETGHSGNGYARITRL